LLGIGLAVSPSLAKGDLPPTQSLAKNTAQIRALQSKIAEAEGRKAAPMGRWIQQQTEREGILLAHRATAHQGYIEVAKGLRQLPVLQVNKKILGIYQRFLEAKDPAQRQPFAVQLREAVSQYLEAQERVAQAHLGARESDLKITERLRSQGAASREEEETKRALLKKARLELEQAKRVRSDLSPLLVRLGMELPLPEGVTTGPTLLRS